MRTSKLKKNKKHIGITLGDPSGIGPEVTAKALAQPSIRKLAQFTIIGDESIYKKYEARNYPSCQMLDCRSLNGTRIARGRSNRLCAKASLNYLDNGIMMLKNKSIDALVTAPVCKEAIIKITPSFLGHTEYLAKSFQKKNAGMMFVSKTLKTILVTRHLPLKKVSRAINSQLVLETILLAHRSLKKDFKIKNPKIAICGLNPHAGEGGIFGDEEKNIILPAIKKAKSQGIQCTGPFAADTLFTKNTTKTYDIVVAMYHDQGLIPIKTLAFKTLVNLTVGLPFVRTSPAHGTAFDIAGQNKADPSSMCEAIKLASQLIS